MSDTLYLQLDQNIEVTNPHVYLQDIAALSMSDPKILNRLRVMPVIVLDAKKPGRYVMSVSDLLKKIQKLEPSIDISPIGETDFIIRRKEVADSRLSPGSKCRAERNRTGHHSCHPFRRGYPSARVSTA